MKPARYRDREDAGRVLAEQLRESVRPPCVIVGIPRGGLRVAGPIARRLGCPLTITFVRKLRLPQAPELAIGALDDDGRMTVDHREVRALGAGWNDVERARARVAAEIRKLKETFSTPPLHAFLPRSTVVLVDDGLATGYTMRAAIAHARRHGAVDVLIAVPCASSAAAKEVWRQADGFFCPRVDPAFTSVGAHYLEFAPVTDDDVAAVLDESREGSRRYVS